MRWTTRAVYASATYRSAFLARDANDA